MGRGRIFSEVSLADGRVRPSSSSIRGGKATTTQGKKKRRAMKNSQPKEILLSLFIYVYFALLIYMITQSFCSLTIRSALSSAISLTNTCFLRQNRGRVITNFVLLFQLMGIDVRENLPLFVSPDVFAMFNKIE